jgi:hypothetical protein
VPRHLIWGLVLGFGTDRKMVDGTVLTDHTSGRDDAIWGRV